MRTPIALKKREFQKEKYPYVSAIAVNCKMYRLCGAVTEKDALEIAEANIRLHPKEITGTQIMFSYGYWRECCERSI